jgi:hypothetical protein
MLKKIDFGKTNFNELYQVFNFDSHEDFEKKRPRLFPSGNTDNEVATTSIFLASLSAIKEYREELLNEIGITKITNYNVQLHTFTELKNTENGDRPDGLIVLTTGKIPIIEWACFVEAKVKDKIVEDGQLEKYSDFARTIGINDIITISNVLVPNPCQSPNKIKKRNFKLFHWSWVYLRVLGNRLIRTNQITDADHVYILKEMNRYFISHKNLYHYTDMGKQWKENVAQFRQYDRNGKKDSGIINYLAKSYAQEEKDVSLHLTDSSEFHIELFANENRINDIEESLNNKSKIVSNFMINKNRKNNFEIEVDFPKQEITCSVKIIIPKVKAQAQTTTLLKMFETEAGVTDKIIIEAYYQRNKKIDKIIKLSQLLDEKNQAIQYSIINKNFGDEIKYYILKTIDNLGGNFNHPKNFISQLESIAERFLKQIIANNK